MTHTIVETTPEPPIACSLTADQYRRRLADTGEFARSALRSRARIPGGNRLTFDDAAEVRDRLEAFVAAESTCCPFLTMDLRREGDRLVLDITGPGTAAPIIEELFA